MANTRQNCHRATLWLSIRQVLKADSMDKGKIFSNVFDKNHNVKSGWKLVTSSTDKDVFFSKWVVKACLQLDGTTPGSTNTFSGSWFVVTSRAQQPGRDQIQSTCWGLLALDSIKRIGLRYFWERAWYPDRRGHKSYMKGKKPEDWAGLQVSFQGQGILFKKPLQNLLQKLRDLGRD